MNEPALLAVKALVSGGLIVLVNAVAKREPGVAGLIVAFPVITLLSALWLVVDGVPDATLSRFVTGVLWGLIPTFGFVLGIVVSLRGGLPLAGAVGAGAIVWIGLTLVIQRSPIAAL